MPTIMPPVAPTATATSATSTEMRAAKMVRDSTSRPTSSVPSQWPEFGACSIAATSRSYGEYGATSGANSAPSTTIVTSTPPSSSSPCRPQRNGVHALVPRARTCRGSSKPAKMSTSMLAASTTNVTTSAAASSTG